jgi:hypothetical protein
MSTKTFTRAIQVTYSVYRPPQLINFTIVGVTLYFAKNRMKPFYALSRGCFTVLTVIPVRFVP